MMGDVYRVLAPPPVIFVVGLALGLLLDAVLPEADLPDVAAIAAGVVLVAAGLALQVRFVQMFHRADTAILPGREAGALVTSGVYRFTRNPGYLGMALTVSGVAMLADAPWALIVVAATILVVDRGVIVKEEDYLEERFGEEYRRYCSSVRRWI